MESGTVGALRTQNRKNPDEGANLRIVFLAVASIARILGTRALQLSMGAPPMVDIEGEIDPLVIAKKELNEKKIPITIRRFLPDGSYEDWTLDELNVATSGSAP